MCTVNINTNWQLLDVFRQDYLQKSNYDVINLSSSIAFQSKCITKFTIDCNMQTKF